VALKRDGSLVSWGTDEVGDASITDTPPGNDFVAAGAGNGFAVALKRDGSLLPWGFDYTWGVVSATPTGGQFAALSVGNLNSLAVRRDGTLAAWGRDDGGQVSGTPAGGGFIAADAGWGHSVALRAAADRTAPVITVPARVEIPATSPAGAYASFAVTAVDDVDGALTPTCSPQSGALFAIGLTTVSCSATDRAGNTARATFPVVVEGAVRQLRDEISFVRSTSLRRATKRAVVRRLRRAEAALLDGRPRLARRRLHALLEYVDAHAGTTIPRPTARRLTADVSRIARVIEP
jgi:hypothetical protein